MALNSINTNAGAMIALESLNATNSALNTAQNEISTGLKVSTATDNGAIWAVAQNERSTVDALGSVQASLNRGISTADVAVSAGQSISDLLNQMKADALSATDKTATTSDIQNYANDFVALRNQIAKIVDTSDFNGVNMINTNGSNVMALASSSGKIQITVAAVNLGLGGGTVTVSASATFSSASTASTVLAAVNTSISQVNAAVAKLGVGVNALQSELSFVQLQTDTLTTGIGNLVDADVAAESATLTALQTKQQLGVQALSIANSSSSHLLSLFQG
jgi:flagellin